MTENADYLAFLRRKIKLASFGGFEIDDSEINPILKPHQRACVKWAVRGGNRALMWPVRIWLAWWGIFGGGV